jgi:hypothetical protein
MTVSFQQILNDLPTDRRQKIEARSAELIADEQLRQDLKIARTLAQDKMVERLQLPKEDLLNLERQSDLHLLMLRNVLREMGGDLRLVIDLPNYPSIDMDDIVEASWAMRAIQTHSQPKTIAYHWLDRQQLPKFAVLQIEEMLREILTIEALIMAGWTDHSDCDSRDQVPQLALLGVDRIGMTILWTETLRDRWERTTLPRAIHNGVRNLSPRREVL